MNKEKKKKKDLKRISVEYGLNLNYRLRALKGGK